MTEEQKQQRIVELEGRTNATAGGDRRRRTVDRDVRGSQAAIWCLLDAPERSDSLIGLVGAPFIATPCRSGSPAAAAPSVRARVDVSTPALAALHARAERRHLGLGRIARHVDQCAVTAGIVEAGRDQVVHAQLAHVPSVIGGGLDRNGEGTRNQNWASH
jgi:hypothetical protein